MARGLTNLLCTEVSRKKAEVFFFFVVAPISKIEDMRWVKKRVQVVAPISKIEVFFVVSLIFVCISYKKIHANLVIHNRHVSVLACFFFRILEAWKLNIRFFYSNIIGDRELQVISREKDSWSCSRSAGPLSPSSLLASSVLLLPCSSLLTSLIHCLTT
jgi:hypothetical protein